MKKFLFILLVAQSLFAQQSKSVDFERVLGNLTVNHTQKSVSGSVSYDFTVLQKLDTIRIDAINMKFSDVKVNGKNVTSKRSAKALLLFEGFKKGKNTVSFNYSATPRQTMYFVGDVQNPQVWTQGQGKYTSHWFPSFDDTNEKVIFNISVTENADLTVVANGVLQKSELIGKSKKWDFKMEHPMSSYLLMLAIGKFESKEIITNSGIPLQLFIEHEDSAKWEPTYRYSKQIFDFLNAEIGVDYPWKIYKQIPVRDFLYGGMENTSATIFARDFVVDDIGYNDRNYVNVNAHELAHQWFGDMVTATSGEHHWLQEGFATYYALLAERSVFGEDYFYMKLYDMAENLERASESDTIPLQNPKASSLTFYQKGAWALHIIREQVGDETFKLAVRNYLNKYKFKNVSTSDFLTELAKVSKFDVDSFSRKWLLSSGFDTQTALKLLRKNKTMNDYFDVVNMSQIPFDQKKQQFETMMLEPIATPIKEEIISQTQDIPFDQKQNLIKNAMLTNDVKVRQMVAKTLREFPPAFEAEFETLLDDESYITQEIAFRVLWTKFPEKRIELLDKLAGRIGLNDKNLRIVWLAFALSTRDYQNNHKLEFYDELLGYSAPSFESNVRINAIETILYLDKSDSNVLPFLVNATTHHKWQTSLFARNKIRELLKGDIYKTYFKELLTKLPESEKKQLEKLLAE